MTTKAEKVEGVSIMIYSTFVRLLFCEVASKRGGSVKDYVGGRKWFRID